MSKNSLTFTLPKTHISRFIFLCFIGVFYYALCQNALSGDFKEEIKIVEMKNGRYLNESCDIEFGKPLESALLKYINSSAVFECEPKRIVQTALREGLLDIREPAFSELGEWSYRCIKPISMAGISAEEWTRIVKPKGTEIPCDVVEVKAESMGLRTYGYVHVQVVKQNSQRKSSKEAPSVHIILLDTVSFPNYMRSMTKTRQVLTENLEAVSFPFLNKVAIGSTPNAMALLFGLQPVDVEETVWGPGIPKPNVVRPFLLSKFKQRNYRTLLAEDDAYIYGCRRECSATQELPDHGLNAYGRRSGFYDVSRPDLYYFDHANSRQTFSEHFDGFCTRKHKPLLEGVNDFINLYQDDAQFSITWITHLAHEHHNALFEVDSEFADFFKRNRENFDNSFVFFMADHGPKHGVIRDVIAGFVEDNNPMLTVIVPKHLRKNHAAHEVIRYNARQLVTHHDVYATFIDILENFQTTSTPYQYNPATHSTDLGSSLIRSLPQPRNCHSLRIPFLYCMCKKTVKRERNTAVGRKIAQLAIDSMNNYIVQNNLTNYCMPVSLHNNSEIEVAEYNIRGVNGEKLVHVLFTTFPADVRFSTEGSIDGDKVALIDQNYFRVTKYPEAEIAYRRENGLPPNYKHFCYFKGLYQSLLN
ncbi:unnamed protein product [Bursaphelenchus xylophilus]|uniref:(pine wood nematode) hypothetical protein n=1 Tax=Bursaphelenchus xylophilus TaxID=6326 RepID=A0A1I7RQD1_BURXY|nr:unnamed protein product [Bursaphelenchus xylophilus]CAG9104388.1 unnamed protein product [Bursaphelenchus xylophilus]